MLLKIHKTSINFLQKTGFSCQFLPNVTSNCRLLHYPYKNRKSVIYLHCNLNILFKVKLVNFW